MAQNQQSTKEGGAVYMDPLYDLEQRIQAMLQEMPPVDVPKLRAQYEADHAEEIAAHRDYISQCKVICRIFERQS